MNSSLIFSLLVNVLVGVYLIWFYPRSVRRNFTDGRIPPAFALLAKLMPVFGAAIIVASAIYAFVTWRGTL